MGSDGIISWTLLAFSDKYLTYMYPTLKYSSTYLILEYYAYFHTYTLYIYPVFSGLKTTSKPSVCSSTVPTLFVYYESIKRELKIRPIYECRCDERLKTKAEESTRLSYTGLLGELGELENLKIQCCLLCHVNRESES